MIVDFNLDDCRDSAVLYKTMYKLVSRKYKKGHYEEAAELALAFFQVSLLGDTTTDDEDIQDLCEPYLATARKNRERYDNKVENDKARKIEDMRLDEIAEYVNNGFTLREIEENTGIPKSTVSYRIGVIKSNYPELLDTSVQVSNLSKLSNPDTDTDTDTVTDTETGTETSTGTVTETFTDNETDNVTYTDNVIALSDKPKAGFAPTARTNYGFDDIKSVGFCEGYTSQELERMKASVGSKNFVY